jgi:hypothetical protein
MGEENMNIRCYWNLHKRCYSIQHKTPNGWRVVDHTDQVWIDAPRFDVSLAGQSRVRREGRKNVHAFIVGTSGDDIDWGETYEDFATDGVEVTYDPYVDWTFVTRRDRQPLMGAVEALLTSDCGRPIVKVRHPFPVHHPA